MLLDELWFRFWEYWHCEKFVADLDEYVRDASGKSLLSCVNFVFMDMAKSCGYICRFGKFWSWEKFYGHEILIYGKILLGIWCWFMENLWLWFWICRNFRSRTWTWSCGNFFQWCGYGNNLVVVYGHVKNFGCGKIWWGIDFLLWDIDIFRRMRIFWTCDFGHGNSYGNSFRHVILVMRIF